MTKLTYSPLPYLIPKGTWVTTRKAHTEGPWEDTLTTKDWRFNYLSAEGPDSYTFEALGYEIKVPQAEVRRE